MASIQFSNPMKFNALINGLILVILGITYAGIIYSYDLGWQSEEDHHFCEKKLYPIPIALLICGFIWLGFFLVRTLKKDKNPVIGEDLSEGEQYKPDVPFIIIGCGIAATLIAIFSWGTVWDACGELTGLSAISMCVFVSLGVGWIYLLRRDQIACFSTKSARFWMALYPFAPVTMWWFCFLCCSTRSGNGTPDQVEVGQLDR